ncbi:beta-galactosidase GalB [Belliella marina]|uniref:Beta-galactosidase GalB n=1 Tax=Belliella marina TaxID=1644146 RepID=A0ABW4VQA9_9BACT
MKKFAYQFLFALVVFNYILLTACSSEENPREVTDFNLDWKFSLGDFPEASEIGFDDAGWRGLELPHDWSIEGSFSEDHPTTPQGGALPAGKGWYRKAFSVPENYEQKEVWIEFDGVYRNSEVWINGHYLGKRPNGYIGFKYDLSPYLVYGDSQNLIAVKVDNEAQPNSRWYTGSGIYRNVRLVATGKLHVDHWGTFVTTPEIDDRQAMVSLAVQLKNSSKEEGEFSLVSRILDKDHKEVAKHESTGNLKAGQNEKIEHSFQIENIKLWKVEDPYLYEVISEVYQNGQKVDVYSTPLGIRYFEFDAQKGFSLNGVSMKIQGVCMHHDLGALGAAVNTRAIQRQLEILKEMGVNAIRTAHNPPAPEVLRLCDQMGFIVQDEAFDAWKKRKAKEDYHKDWDEWYQRDLEDLIKRDRNHPSIMMWSIGNEIREQFDSTGLVITKELADIVKALDTTRPVTAALTENEPEKNFIYQSGALDLLGFNYKHEAYADFSKTFPGEAIIASENMSALATRGFYQMPSDSTMRWPEAHDIPLETGNDAYAVSAYDHVSAYWGSTHEETWKTIKALDYMAGLFVWTGFDYLGEPIPYPYPARSSYFGIVDLAGFPKDAYYMYQSEWTKDPVLHIFPHWNWKEGELVDVWAYYNQADEVELFLNGKSVGVQKKQGDDLHVMWRIPFEKGTFKAVSKKDGEVVLEKEIHTAGAAHQIEAIADRTEIDADGKDLSFIKIKVLDEQGNLVPDAANLINFEISGPGKIVGVDNGYQASLESFKSPFRKAFNGMCLVIVQSERAKGTVTLLARSEGLEEDKVSIRVK